MIMISERGLVCVCVRRAAGAKAWQRPWLAASWVPVDGCVCVDIGVCKWM